MNVDPGLISLIINTLVLLMGVLGGGAIWAKIKQVLEALAETGDVTAQFRLAIKDDKFTEAEIETIIKEINEAKGAWENVFAGKK